MLALIGIIVVIGAVVGGYLLEHGNLAVLFQPAELLIIFGAAFGAFLISSPLKVIKMVASNILSVFGFSGGGGRALYMEILVLLYVLLTKVRKDGLVSIEDDVDNPRTSQLFSKSRGVMLNNQVLEFTCDNLRVMITAHMKAHEFNEIMELDIETRHKEDMLPASSIAEIADSLPGLGIVAAVLGVVLTMGKMDEPPAVLGHSIGAALVGTFLGVLMCYGFVGPMGKKLEHKAMEHESYLHVIRTTLVAFMSGAAPQVAVEFGRRAVPLEERPRFEDLEKELKG